MNKSCKFRQSINDIKRMEQISVRRGYSRISKDTDSFIDIVQKKNSVHDPDNLINNKSKHKSKRLTTQQINVNPLQKSIHKKSLKTTITENLTKKNQNLKSLNYEIYKAAMEKSKFQPWKLEQYFDELRKIYSKRQGYNRKAPLMFLKPYLRYKADKDLEIGKTEIYNQISKSKEFPQKKLMIEYFTQYGDQFEQQHQNNYKKSKTLCPHVLKQKLKIQQKNLSKEIKVVNPNNSRKSNVCYLNNFLKIF